MTRDDPRPFVLTGLAFLALAALAAGAGALGLDILLPDTAVWFLLAGWLFPAWLGTVVWYWEPFVQRKLPPAWLVRAPLVLVGVALALLLVATFAPPRASVHAFTWFTRALAAGLVLPALTLGAAAFKNARVKRGRPKWRADSPHRAGDVLAAAASAGALVNTAAAGVVLAAFPSAGPGAPAFTLLSVGFGVQAIAALAFHFLPRVVKTPLVGLMAMAMALAVAALNAGSAGLAATFLARGGSALGPRGTALAALGVLGLGAFVALTPFRAPHGSPPRLLAAGRAWLVAGGASFVLAGVVGLLVSARFATLGAFFPGLLALVTAAAALAFAGFAVIAWPVAFNAVPRGAVWARAGAVSGGVGAVLASAGVASTAVARAGALLLVVAALAHVAQIAPFRTPRRACPPGE